MTRFWAIDSPLMMGLGNIADIIILNLIHVLCCIPIVTIGAAYTALYTVTLKMTRKESPSILKEYFRAFKSNFKISTLCWLIVIAVSALLWFDFQLLNALEGSIKSAAMIALGVVLIVYLLVMLYLFPYIARFKNSIFDSFKNALLMSIAQLPTTLFLAVLTIGTLIIVFFTSRTFVIATIIGFFFGLSAMAYVKSKLFTKVFTKYESSNDLIEGN